MARGGAWGPSSRLPSPSFHLVKPGQSRLAGLPVKKEPVLFNLHSLQTEKQHKVPAPGGPWAGDTRQGHHEPGAALPHPAPLARAPGAPGAPRPRRRLFPGSHQHRDLAVVQALTVWLVGAPMLPSRIFSVAAPLRGDWGPDPALIKMQTAPELKESGSVSRRRRGSLVSRGRGGLTQGRRGQNSVHSAPYNSLGTSISGCDSPGYSF